MAISKGLLQFDRRDPRLDELPDEVAIEIMLGCNGAHTLDAIVDDGRGHRGILQPRTIHVDN
jgi:hypothetical protein